MWKQESTALLCNFGVIVAVIVALYRPSVKCVNEANTYVSYRLFVLAQFTAKTRRYMQVKQKLSLPPVHHQQQQLFPRYFSIHQCSSLRCSVNHVKARMPVQDGDCIWLYGSIGLCMHDALSNAKHLLLLSYMSTEKVVGLFCIIQ